MSDYSWCWELARVIVPAFIVALGWWVVSKDNDRRETRKEIRQCIDRTTAKIEKIKEDAIEYFTAPGSAKDRELADRLDFGLFRLEKTLSILELKNSENNQLSCLFLRASITGRPEYRKEDRAALAHTDEELYKIKAQAERLIDEMERSYKRSYQR